MKYFIRLTIILFLVFSVSQDAYSISLKDAQKDYLYGNYHEAIQKAHLLKPTDETLYFLGLAYTKIGNYPKAQVYLNKLIKRYPSSLFHGQ